MTTQSLSKPWSLRMVRLLGVDRYVCQKRVNDARAHVGISPVEVEDALKHQRALRTALATALPLPSGSVWTALGWMRDVRSVASEHALSSACVAYLRNPEFFERADWPSELIDAMSPVRDDRLATASLVAAILGAATARTQVRRLVRGRGGLIRRLALRGGAAMAWGKIEAHLGTQPVDRHANEKIRRGETPREAPAEHAGADPFAEPIGEVLPLRPEPT